MTKKELIKKEKATLLNTYSRPEFVITHGEGMYLYDSDGKKYLDFVAGIAVNAFGYGDELTRQALIEQSQKLWHCSNLYYNEPQVELADFLVTNTFADKVFFCNSGTEAMEAAIKFARKWAAETKSPACYQIISFTNSFHGRTYGALSATGQPKFRENFGPMLPGFEFAEFNNIDSVKKMISDKTCAILVEPIQGEGGIFPADPRFMLDLEVLCKEKNCLLIFDEIQCGFGRTGTFCAYEHYNIIPDIMTVAKPIAGGLPLGAVLLNDKVAEHIVPGNHGTTFGGGPLVTHVALSILSRIVNPEFLKSIKQKSDYIVGRLKKLAIEFPEILAVRGKGLMIGIELAIPPQDLIGTCAKNGLLICRAGSNAVRFLPPLVIENIHIDEAITKLGKALLMVREKNG